MDLDWDFYFDDWLIDKVPDGFEIRVESHPNGEIINPPELDIYFGANPRYLYGTGKLLHEVIMSPSGIAVFPSFLDRPGFEFVESISFSLGFNESKDFHGNDVQEKHVGLVDVTEYMKNVTQVLHGVADGEFFLPSTPSAALVSLNEDNRNAIIADLSDQYVYPLGIPSPVTCYIYSTLSPNVGTGELDNIVPGATTYLDAYAPGSVITTPGTHSNVVFTKYTYIRIHGSVT